VPDPSLKGQSTVSEKWPRRLIASDNHLIVHKIASVEIKNGILSFLFIDDTGRTYAGPFYCSLINNVRPTAERELAANGLRDAEEIRYVIAAHSGAFPNGHPTRLLRAFPCPESEEYAAAVQRADEEWTRAHKATSG
jgi:hypothetical protein